MERKVISSELKEIIGEYGIVKVKEQLIWSDGSVFSGPVIYDVCLEHGEGDIVASFNNLKDARKWIKEY